MLEGLRAMLARLVGGAPRQTPAGYGSVMSLKWMRRMFRMHDIEVHRDDGMRVTKRPEE